MNALEQRSVAGKASAEARRARLGEGYNAEMARLAHRGGRPRKPNIADYTEEERGKADRVLIRIGINAKTNKKRRG